MTSWWEEWFIPFLGADVAGPAETGTPSQPEARERKRRGSVRDVAVASKEKLLYCNHTMATMLRLHQMLHERMIEAKVMAMDERNEAGPSRENQLLDPDTPRDSDGFNLSPQLAIKRRGQDPFQSFINVLLSMLRGHVGVDKYEDECRSLLGTSSYKLFTLDKLIPRLIKETNNLATSESWRKIRAAYDQFNGISPDGGKCEPLNAQEYRWRMGEEFHHNCFEVHYNTSTHQMTIVNVTGDADEESLRRMTAAEREQQIGPSAGESELDEDGGDGQMGGDDDALEDDDAGNAEASALLKNLEQDAKGAAQAGDADEGEQKGGDAGVGGVDDGMEVDEEGEGQEPLIRRPTLGYGNDNAEESEEESDA